MKINLKLCCLMLALLSTLALAAEEPAAPEWYQVEVIVFEDLSANALNSEDWPLYPALPVVADTVELHDPQHSFFSDDNYINAFQKLPETDFMMKKEQRALDRKEQYKTLVHMAWRQQLTEPKQSQPIHLFGGRSFSQHRNQRFSEYYGQAAYDENDVWEMDGTLSLSKDRYINVKADLTLNLPAEELYRVAASSDYSNFNTSRRISNFHLRESRRMRAGELHYIDHPLFGVLVKVSKIKVEAPKPFVERKLDPVVKPRDDG